MTHSQSSRLLRSPIAATAIALVLVCSGPASADTLKDAIAATYRYNARLDAARAAQRATDEEVARANSGYRPTISGSADAGVQHTDTRSTSGATSRVDTNPAGYGITASQPIFRGFQTLNGVRVAEATVRAGRENLRAVEQAVLLDAITAFMDVIRDQSIVKIRENAVEVLTRELKATRERFAVGEVTRTDVAQAEARRAAAVSALDLAKANLATSRGSYERHVGRAPSKLIEPAQAKNLPKSLDEAVYISSRENPAVIAALYREQGARHTVDQIWGQLLPTLNLEGAFSRRFNSSSQIEQVETTQVVARLTVPLYTSGAVQAQVRGAKHTHVSRLQEVEQNRGDIQAQVVQFWSQLLAAKAQLESDNAQVNALSTALAGVREEEKVGQRTLLDILNAEQELLNAQVNLAATKRNIVVASYALQGSIGRLSVQELSAVSEVYDPNVHYHEVRRKWWGVSITRAGGRPEFHDFWEALGRVFHGERTATHGGPAPHKLHGAAGMPTAQASTHAWSGEVKVEQPRVQSWTNDVKVAPKAWTNDVKAAANPRTGGWATDMIR